MTTCACASRRAHKERVCKTTCYGCMMRLMHDEVCPQEERFMRDWGLFSRCLLCMLLLASEKTMGSTRRPAGIAAAVKDTSTAPEHRGHAARGPRVRARSCPRCRQTRTWLNPVLMTP